MTRNKLRVAHQESHIPDKGRDFRRGPSSLAAKELMQVPSDVGLLASVATRQ